MHGILVGTDNILKISKIMAGLFTICKCMLARGMHDALQRCRSAVVFNQSSPTTAQCKVPARPIARCCTGCLSKPCMA